MTTLVYAIAVQYTNVYQSVAHQLPELLSYAIQVAFSLKCLHQNITKDEVKRLQTLNHVLVNNDDVCLRIQQLISVTRRPTCAVRQMPQVFRSDNKRQLTAQNVYETCR